MASSSLCSVALQFGRCQEHRAAATLLSRLQRRLTEPLLETDVAESHLAQGNQRAFLEFSPEIAGLRIGHNLARIVARGEPLTDQLVETELLRTGHFNGAVHRHAHGNPGDRLRDVISSHWLKEH